MLQHATWKRSLHIQTFIALAHKIRSKHTRCITNTFSCKTSLIFTLYFSNFIYSPSSLRGRQQRRDIPEKKHMEPQLYPFFSALKRNIRENSVTVSSRSPGCCTAIESLIPALTARVLQLYATLRTHADVYIYYGNAENMQLLSYE